MASRFNAQVNFIRRSRQTLEKVQQRDRQIFYGSLGFFFIVLLVLGGVGGYWWYLQQQLNDVLDRQQSAQAVVSKAAKQEAELLVYITRLDMIHSVLSQRQTKNHALEFLQSIAQPNMAFDSITFDGEKKLLTFRAQAQSVVTLEAFLAKMRTPEIWEKMSNVKLSSINRSATGVYSLDVELQLNEDKVENRGI